MSSKPLDGLAAAWAGSGTAKPAAAKPAGLPAAGSSRPATSDLSSLQVATMQLPQQHHQLQQSAVETQAGQQGEQVHPEGDSLDGQLLSDYELAKRLQAEEDAALHRQQRMVHTAPSPGGAAKRAGGGGPSSKGPAAKKAKGKQAAGAAAQGKGQGTLDAFFSKR